MGYDIQNSPEQDQALISTNHTIILINLLPQLMQILASSTLESCFITENQVVILTESDTSYCIK